LFPFSSSKTNSTNFFSSSKSCPWVSSNNVCFVLPPWPLWMLITVLLHFCPTKVSSRFWPMKILRQPLLWLFVRWYRLMSVGHCYHKAIETICFAYTSHFADDTSPNLGFFQQTVVAWLKLIDHFVCTMKQQMNCWSKILSAGFLAKHGSPFLKAFNFRFFSLILYCGSSFILIYGITIWDRNDDTTCLAWCDVHNNALAQLRRQGTDDEQLLFLQNKGKMSAFVTQYMLIIYNFGCE
jgi:hypothetical protein